MMPWIAIRRPLDSGLRTIRRSPRSSDGADLRGVFHHRPPADHRFRECDVAGARMGRFGDMVGRGDFKRAPGGRRSSRATPKAVGRFVDSPDLHSVLLQRGVCVPRRRGRLCRCVERMGPARGATGRQSSRRKTDGVPGRSVGAQCQLSRGICGRLAAHRLGLAIARPCLTERRSVGVARNNEPVTTRGPRRVD